MAITQNDFSTQPGGAVPGQSGDTSPMINATLTVADGSTFEYGDPAVSSADGEHYCENMAARAAFFEGVVARCSDGVAFLAQGLELFPQPAVLRAFRVPCPVTAVPAVGHDRVEPGVVELLPRGRDSRLHSSVLLKDPVPFELLEQPFLLSSPPLLRLGLDLVVCAAVIHGPHGVGRQCC